MIDFRHGPWCDESLGIGIPGKGGRFGVWRQMFQQGDRLQPKRRSPEMPNARDALSKPAREKERIQTYHQCMLHVLSLPVQVSRWLGTTLKQGSVEFFCAHVARDFMLATSRNSWQTPTMHHGSTLRYAFHHRLCRGKPQQVVLASAIEWAGQDAKLSVSEIDACVC
jgi:hypothetical protein